ncbi:MAG: TlpA family protein disulfide reductase [Roseiflexaceae bacterium]|nr:TlpA family protein disulfide reductase [Roseiflexaceae bacterium]
MRLLLIAVAAMLVSCAAPTPSAPAAVPVVPAPGAILATNALLLDTSTPLMPEIGQPAPDFQFTLPDGTTQKLSDLQGKKVLLNFWATWCEPCRDEMPHLEQARQAYGDDLVILAVNKAEKAERIASFTNDIPVGFALIADPDADVANRYSAVNLPLTFFINRDGTVAARELKVMSYATITGHIDQLK